MKFWYLTETGKVTAWRSSEEDYDKRPTREGECSIIVDCPIPENPVKVIDGQLVEA